MPEEVAKILKFSLGDKLRGGELFRGVSQETHLKKNGARH